ncbi:HEAT repeat domain-containing protein [Vibrio maerlii]|uniref:HEAT repeat domain-containing protein n=1 Tax=Vibrio maerlii TaxID=2231648 RepID=UPI0013DEA348|nr:HEAT repeat domain-containing protein [Vibrio maerlii]
MKAAKILLLSLFASTAIAASNPADQASINPQGNTQSIETLKSQDRATQLSYIAQDKSASAKERSEALQELASYPSQNALVAIARALKSPNAEIRAAAVAGAIPYQVEYRWRLVSPLLLDDNKEVRHAAALNLAKDYQGFNAEQKKLLLAPISELKEDLGEKSDLESQLTTANLERWTGQYDQAAKMYQELTSKPLEATEEVWLNYADNFRAQSDDQSALALLEKGLTHHNDSANLHYSKALTLVRLENRTEAAKSMESAANLAESNSYFWYLNGVLQENVNIDESVKSFEQAYLISGSPEQLYALCDIYIKSNNDKAELCIQELSKIAPADVIESLKKS